MHLKERCYQVIHQSCFIFGPRGTGKSTWLKIHYPDALFINLLDDFAYRSYQAQPEKLLEVVRAYQNQRVFIIDEIQKIPSLLNSVHLLIEENKELQFILTGSSARKLKRAGVDLLAGRAILTNFHPFMARELNKDFHLEKALKYGMVPLIIASSDPEKVLNTYITLYIKEEVQAEGLVRNIGHFSRFLEIISFSHASIINKNHIARECQVTRKLVENYISILEDLLIAFQIPVFTKRAKRQTIASNKFYLFDPGVFTLLRPHGPLDYPEEIQGLALEGLVAQQLRAWCDYSNEQTQIFYWHTKGGVEVDFILYGPKHFYAIEVKNSKIIHPQDLRGLKTFKTDYPEAIPVFLYRGNEKRLITDILCLPVADFLLHLEPKKKLI